MSVNMRRGELVPQAFQAPVDVHASADGQVYMFRERENELVCSSEEEDCNVMELRPRVHQNAEQDSRGSVQFLEHKVLDGDNLNKLALRYGCKVADLKRVNNLIQEQDLFALKSLKIPLQRHSFLTEAYTDPSNHQHEFQFPSTPSVQYQDRPRGNPHLQEVTDYLKEVDHDIEHWIQTTNAREEVFASEIPHRFGFRGQRLTGYGADWGIQWWNAVVAMLLIGIILPIFYIVYFKTKDNGVTSPVDATVALNVSITSSTGSPGHFQEPA